MATKSFKPAFSLILILLAFFGIIALWAVRGYNRMVKQEETVRMQWSQVENQYERRADLIPNLVSTVKGYAAHEQSTLTQVIEARAKATQIQVNANDLSPEKMEQFNAVQGELSQALNKLMAVVESYPDLKAGEQFIMLQSQLEGTENRIAVERKKFNSTANVYNSSLRRFPRNILASIFGFKQIPYFSAEPGAEKAPEVQF